MILPSITVFFFSHLMRMVSRFDRFFFRFSFFAEPNRPSGVAPTCIEFFFCLLDYIYIFFFWINFIFKDRFRCGYARVHLRPGV